MRLLPSSVRVALLALAALTALACSAAEVGVRVRFGLTDQGNTVW
ncbi:MAG: hypothetical protein RLZZ15_4460, partial [Verrucomicrobiota bacterium]